MFRSSAALLGVVVHHRSYAVVIQRDNILAPALETGRSNDLLGIEVGRGPARSARREHWAAQPSVIPLTRLQLPQSSCRLRAVLEPPMPNGMMWSNSRSFCDLHSTHLP